MEDIELTELDRLKEANRKLMKSNQELMDEQKNGKYISPEQFAEFQRLVQEHIALNVEVGNVTAFLRNNDKRMKQGKYSSMSFSKMVIHILQRPRLFGMFW